MLSSAFGTFWEARRSDKTPNDLPTDAKLAGDGTEPHTSSVQRHHLLVTSVALVPADLFLAFSVGQRRECCLLLHQRSWLFWLGRSERLVSSLSLRTLRGGNQALSWRKIARHAETLCRACLRCCEGCLLNQRQTRPLTIQQPLHVFAQVLDQMIAISHLGGIRQRSVHRISIGTSPISADYLNLRMVFEPGEHGRTGAVRQQVEWPVGLEVDQDRSILVCTSHGKVIDAQHRHIRSGRVFDGPQIARASLAPSLSFPVEEPGAHSPRQRRRAQWL